VPPREWFGREVLDVGPDLLGATLTTTTVEGSVTLRITEVEAYRGLADPGSHAFRGPTARNAAMFGEPGRLYVYRHLGLHTCVNLVCGPPGLASAALLRAGEVVDGVELARARRVRAGVVRSDTEIARGPARLAVALGIDLSWYGRDVTEPSGAVVVRVPRGVPSSPGEPSRAGEPGAVVWYRSGPRVGVGGPGGDAAVYPWRFWLDDEPTVSAYRAAAPRRRRATKP
jgi:DNA-3-methyladenine glycosylase